MKGVALFPPNNKSIDDICNDCEFKNNCLLAYTASAYDCENKAKPKEEIDE